jgi:hypothetical protein
MPRATLVVHLCRDTGLCIAGVFPDPFDGLPTVVPVLHR